MSFENRAYDGGNKLADPETPRGIQFKDAGKASKQKILLVISFIVILVLAIAFLILYVKERDSNANKDGTTQAQNTTAEPTSIAPTTTKEPDYGKGPWENVRLPRYFEPSTYDLLLKVDIKKLVFSGHVTVKVTLKNVSDYMYLHVNKLNITSPKLLKKDGTKLALSRDFWYKKNEFYVLEPESQLPTGDYQIEMDFIGKLDDDLKGLYRSTYKNEKNEEITIATTQLQPTDARKVFPCFDEPSYKAKFTVTIVRQKDLISITNMPKIKSGPEKNGMVADYYEETVTMPTYLLAFIVCDFKYVQRYAGQRNTSMRYYSQAAQIDQTDLASDVGGKLLKIFEDYFNISYPLPKADMIAIPDFAAGAMENWGLITYRETAMLFKEGQSSESNKQRIILVIAHELAHMWFGNLVTPVWWDDLWLNEGFASYIEYVGIDELYSDWQMKDYFVISDMKSAFSLDSLVTSHPIKVPVNHPDEINEIFDSISYNKGATVLRMLQYFLTEKVFTTGLTNYLNHHQYGNARTKDLWDFLTNAATAANKNINVAEIMDTWTLQMGYPVITVESKNQDILLSQKRFLSDPNANVSNSKYTSSYGYKWHVPFTIEVRDWNTNQAINTDATNITWMKPKDGTVTVNGKTWNQTTQWVKGNVGQTGFYRVNYPVENWIKLANQLQHNHTVLSVADRTGLIQDAFALADAKLLEFKYALDLTKYLDKEKDFIPWSASYDGITFLYSILPRTSRVHRGLKNYRFQKAMPTLDRLGFNDSGSHLEKYMRTDAISAACSNNNETCLKRMKEYFDKWIEDESANPVPANLRTLVYFYGMSQSGQKEWDTVFGRFTKTNVASERYKLLYGLAGVNEPWLIIRYLQYAFNSSKIKTQDTAYVVSFIANANPIGRHFAWNFLKERWPTILETYGGGLGFTIGRFISGIAGLFSTEWEYEQVQSLFQKYPSAGSGTRARDQLLERIRSNIDWRKENEKVLEQWLDDNGY